MIVPGSPDGEAAALPEWLRGAVTPRVVPLSELARAAESDPDALILLDGASLVSLAASLGDEADHALLRSVGEGICVTDAAGTELWSNARYAELGEKTKERCSACCAEAAGSFLGAGAGIVSRRFSIEGGDEKHYELNVSPVDRGPAGDGGVAQVIALLWDTTSSHRARRKIDAIDQAGAALVKLDAQAVKELNAVQRVALLEEKIVRCAHDLLQFDHFTIHLLNEKTNRLELVMSRGLPEAVRHMDLYASREENGITGYVAATGQSYLCPNVLDDPRYIQGIESPGSALTVPLLLQDKVIGVFNVESDRPEAFTQADRQFLQIFARYVALAFHFLDILVVERYTTNEALSGRVEGEISEPLADLLAEAEWLIGKAADDPVTKRHADQIVHDVESIKRRMREVATGPRSILGTELVLGASESDPVIAGRRVLVADDEPTIRNTISDVISRRGGVVVSCATGAEAIAEIEKWTAGEIAGFDLVISDIHMPDRNGYQVFSATKAAGQAVPVILMTGFGYDPHHSIVRASEEGLQCVLFKPFRALQLLEELHKALAPEDAGDPGADDGA